MDNVEIEPQSGPCVRLVFGFGNPGPRYERTRHNVGFHVADRLATRLGVRFDLRLIHSVAARAEIDGAIVWICKPQCFMNRSGMAVRELSQECGDSRIGILVIYDDFHLPIGTLRFRARGSAGGHNGVRSTLEALGHDEFHRLRVGIGTPPPGEDPADYVLAFIPEEEREVLAEAVDRAAAGAHCWSSAGDIQACMNRYNSGVVE